MNHPEVAHRWANDQYNRNGELNGGRMFATQSNRCIYSYNRNFCIARKTDNIEFPLLYTSRDHSVSTSKHKSYVRNAISRGLWEKVFYCFHPSDGPLSILEREWVTLKDDDLPALKAAPEKVAAMKKRIAARASKGQPESLTLTERLATLESKAAWQQKAISDRASQLARFAKAFKVNLKTANPGTHAIAQSFLKSKDLMTLSDTLEKLAAKAEKARLKAEKERAEKQARMNAENRERWIAGEPVQYRSNFSEPTALRLLAKAGLVETSKGANVPLRHALRLFDLATACRERGETWASPPEKTVKIGHYELSTIDALGNVTISCHELAFDEMARIAPAVREAANVQPAEIG